MPLFVVNEKIENLDIDAIVLPFYEEIKNYYKTNYYNSKSLYEIYNTVIGEENAEKLTELKNKLNSKIEQISRIKNILDKRIDYFDYKIPIIKQNIQGMDVDFNKDINNYRWHFYPKTIKSNVRDDVAFLNNEENKRNILIERKTKIEKLEDDIKDDLDNIENNKLQLNSFLDKNFISINYKFNKKIHLNDIYEEIIKFAINHKLSKIAIPIIDFFNMPNNNYYIRSARNSVRYYLKKSENDITVYLVLTDTNNEYCQDSEPEENIYEKIASVYERHNNVDKYEIEEKAKKEFEKYNEYLNKKNQYKLLKNKEESLCSEEEKKFMNSFWHLEFEYRDFNYNKQYSDDDYLEY